MRSILFLAIICLFPCEIQAQKVCQSCLDRQHSHQDDLSRVGYYEDFEHFKEIQENSWRIPEDSSKDSSKDSSNQNHLQKKKIKKSF